MKSISEKEMREVSGGKWKCNYCGKKFWLYNSANIHKIGHGYKARKAKVTWCWW